MMSSKWQLKQRRMIIMIILQIEHVFLKADWNTKTSLVSAGHTCGSSSRQALLSSTIERSFAVSKPIA